MFTRHGRPASERSNAHSSAVSFTFLHFLFYYVRVFHHGYPSEPSIVEFFRLRGKRRHCFAVALGGTPRRQSNKKLQEPKFANAARRSCCRDRVWVSRASCSADGCVQPAPRRARLVRSCHFDDFRSRVPRPVFSFFSHLAREKAWKISREARGCHPSEAALCGACGSAASELAARQAERHNLQVQTAESGQAKDTFSRAFSLQIRKSRRAAKDILSSFVKSLAYRRTGRNFFPTARF